MSYSWETEVLEAYGEETRDRLVNEQKRYEEEKEDNDCAYCGYRNEGSVVEWPNRVMIMHYGLWEDDRCTKCGRMMEE